MTREEMVALRDKIIRGSPPYRKDDMGNMIRDKGGVRGVEELRKLGDFSPDASSNRFSLEVSLALTDHLLERMR